MRLKCLAAVGAVLVFVMLGVNGEENASEETSSRAILLVIDTSFNMSKSDSGCSRIEMAECFLEQVEGVNCSNNDEFALWIGDRLDPISGDRYWCHDCENISGILNDRWETICSPSCDKEVDLNEIISRSTDPQYGASKSKSLIICIISNGVFNISDFESTLNLAKKENITIDTMGLGKNSEGLERLRNISSCTNGTFYYWDIYVNVTPRVSYGSIGTLVKFEINVTNTGTSNLSSVVVTDTLTKGLDYVESNGFCSGKNGHYLEIE
jgi:uncharacterized repeat protein (TIGR01451 family)